MFGSYGKADTALEGLWHTALRAACKWRSDKLSVDPGWSLARFSSEEFTLGKDDQVLGFG